MSSGQRQKHPDTDQQQQQPPAENAGSRTILGTLRGGNHQATGSVDSAISSGTDERSVQVSANTHTPLARSPSFLTNKNSKAIFKVVLTGGVYLRKVFILWCSLCLVVVSLRWRHHLSDGAFRLACGR